MRVRLPARGYGHISEYAWIGTQRAFLGYGALSPLTGCYSVGVKLPRQWLKTMLNIIAEQFTAWSFCLPLICWCIFVCHLIAYLLYLRLCRQLLIVKITNALYVGKSNPCMVFGILPTYTAAVFVVNLFLLALYCHTQNDPVKLKT